MKHIACLVGIAGITFIFFLLAFYVEKNIALYNMVVPHAGVQLDQWLDSFWHWAIVGIIISGVASLFWYILGQWVFKINRWEKSGKRGIWLCFILLPVVAIILEWIFTKKAQAGAWPAYLFYALNGLLCYYLATALCSPSSFKYTPLLASRVWRRAW
ncbi:hypothetical protein FJZ31_00420 [Candidatus Poribacteria bacterium]|nr:hypothetical protein [Candidatus Poribacteria bacterium]